MTFPILALLVIVLLYAVAIFFLLRRFRKDEADSPKGAVLADVLAVPAALFVIWDANMLSGTQPVDEVYGKILMMAAFTFGLYPLLQVACWTLALRGALRLVRLW